eukprot:jgi/Chrzof1/12238/Cz06g26190.t1
MSQRTFCRAQVVRSTQCTAQEAAQSIRGLLSSNTQLPHDIIVNLTAAANALDGQHTSLLDVDEFIPSQQADATSSDHISEHQAAAVAVADTPLKGSHAKAAHKKRRQKSEDEPGGVASSSQHTQQAGYQPPEQPTGASADAADAVKQQKKKHKKSHPVPQANGSMQQHAAPQSVISETPSKTKHPSSQMVGKAGTDSAGRPHPHHPAGGLNATTGTAAAAAAQADKAHKSKQPGKADAAKAHKSAPTEQTGMPALTQRGRRKGQKGL